MKLECILSNKILLLFVIGIVQGYPGERYLHPTIHFAEQKTNLLSFQTLPKPKDHATTYNKFWNM